MNLKCLFGMHRWTKVGGPANIGNGRFEQKIRCIACGKTRYHVS